MAEAEEAETQRQREIIDLRMQEYDTLRTEIIQRINARQQIAGYAGAATVITAALGVNIGYWRWLVVALVVLVALGYLRDSNKGIQRIGLHLQEVERDVNELAQAIYGRPVLMWETRREGQRKREPRFWKGVGVIGGWVLRKPIKELPPQRVSSEESNVNSAGSPR